MKFRTHAFREEPEINFIPLIDVLLVILIFLIITTTYTKQNELQINLPTAESSKPAERVDQVDIAVDASGKYVINKVALTYTTREAFAAELKRAAGENKDPVITISADAQATHQSVIRVMEAAQFAGYGKIAFTIQPAKK
ncbi:MAG TPA: biopolymer transporter ExbD [Burkholderiales bacterium]|nr:biopolymer transporter ExbD [Burkholderiales bacterium]